LEESLPYAKEGNQIMKKFTLVLIASFLSSAQTFAGTWSSGGGNAVVCKAEDGSIASAELLDLYEGRYINHLVYPASSEPALSQALAAARRISSIAFSGDRLAQTVQRVQSQIQFLPKGFGIQPINDSDSVILPPANCQIVQVARYEPNGTIFVNADVWQLLSAQNQAALLLHEALYWELRLFGEKNSKRARIAVATAFSDRSIDAYDSGVPKSGEACVTTGSSPNLFPWATFASYPNADGNGTVIQFWTFAGMPMLSKSTIFLPGVKWPLSNLKSDFFVYSKMESAIDAGLGVYFRTTPKNKKRTGLIGPMDGLNPPHIPFTCKKMSN
jgi:hypothetical protein